MRFTLCKLFLGVTMAALASAGMTLHTRLWAEAIVSFSVVLYAAVAILSFRGGGQVRAFRVAFAVVGGGYLLLVLCNMFTPIRDLLVTNRVLVLAGRSLRLEPNSATLVASTNAPNAAVIGYLDQLVASGTTRVSLKTGTVNLPSGSQISSFDEWDTTFGFGSPTPDPRLSAGAFLVIGHCVWSWLLALAAGCFAAFVTRPRAPAAA